MILSTYLKRALWLTTGGLLATGLIFLYMKYAMTATDPFSVINHPWQTTTLKVHIALAAAFLFVFGMFVVDHFIPKIKHQVIQGKKSGWFSFIASLAMCTSGYALQIFHSPSLHPWLVGFHSMSGVLFFLFLIGHVYTSRR